MYYPAVMFEVSRKKMGPTTTPPFWYEVIMLIVLVKDLFWISAAQHGSNLVSWNGAVFFFFTIFWPYLQIGSSEKPYQILRDYLQLYQTVILELNHHFTFQGSHRKNIVPMTAGSNSRRWCPLSQQSVYSGLGTLFWGLL